MYLDTFGVNIDITTNYDLTGNTSVTLDVFDTAGVATSRAVTVTNEASGIVRYVAEEGHFPLKGEYYLQVVADFGADKRLRADRVLLIVR